MTTGKIVDHDGATGTFSLPADHAAILTRAAGPGNLAAIAQNVGMVALVEDQIVDCFRHGGGVPYSAYPRLQPIIAETTGAVYDATLIDVTLPLVPGLVDRLGQGIDVADVGCGSGHAVNLMAEAFPRSRFTGFDLSDDGIAAAAAEAGRKDLANARFEKRDAARLGETARFDFITTFDSVHDQARPDRALAGVAEALRPGGVYLCVDVSRVQYVVGEFGSPTRAILLHHLLHALHDRLPRRRRNGPRRDVGRAKSPGNACRRGLHLHPDRTRRRRHHQHVFHCHQGLSRSKRSAASPACRQRQRPGCGNQQSVIRPPYIARAWAAREMIARVGRGRWRLLLQTFKMECAGLLSPRYLDPVASFGQELVPRQPISRSLSAPLM